MARDSGGNLDRACHWRSGKKVCQEGWSGHLSQCFSEASPLDIETQRPLEMLEKAIILESGVKGDSKWVKESREGGRKGSQHEDVCAEIEKDRESCWRECGMREGSGSSGPRMNVLGAGIRASARKDCMHTARKTYPEPHSKAGCCI